MGEEPFSYPHDLLHPMAHGLLDFVAQRRYSLTVAVRGGACPHRLSLRGAAGFCIRLFEDGSLPTLLLPPIRSQMKPARINNHLLVLWVP